MIFFFWFCRYEQNLPHMCRCPYAECMGAGWLVPFFSIHHFHSDQMLLKIYCFIQCNRLQISSMSAISLNVLPCCCVEILTALSGSLAEFISWVLWYIFLCLAYFYFEQVVIKRSQAPVFFCWSWHLTHPLSWIFFLFFSHGHPYVSKPKIPLITATSRICAGPKSDFVLTRAALHAKLGLVLRAQCWK